MNMGYASFAVLANVLLSLFWLTWGLRLFAMLLITAGAVIFHKLRIKKIKNEKADLERQVLERNELLSYSKLNEQKAIKEAEAANKNKTLLISKISYEIRTPMNAMMGMASLLNETSLTQEQREYTATIQSSGENLLSVINEILMNDILEYSKVESGNELEEKDFDLSTNIEEVLDVFAVKAAKSDIELVYHINDNVPVQISGDALRLRQILMNLIENAFRFTSKGEIFVGVQCIENRDNNRIKLEFEIRDTGGGMTPARIAQVTKDLQQTGTFAETNEAIGLTLVMCKRLVNLMNGSIKVESREKEGTAFKFTIWTKRSQQVMRSQNQVEMAGLEGKKVLIIDNNETVCNSIKSQLKQWKLLPTAATSGKQALEILSQNPAFDLIITDYKMPVMDGIQLTQSVKQQYAELPVILLNQSGEEGFRQNIALFSAVINKPLRQHILSKEVFRGLQKKSADSSLYNEQNNKKKLSSEFSKQYPLSILIAEDDKLNQKFALKILNKLGYEVPVANNGQEVLELVSQKNYDVILMDVQMPVMNGLDATKMIRLCLAEQPYIIAMTANTLQGDREECIMAGMDEYISKPINLKDLVMALEKCALQVKKIKA